jgi:hypothetical protein
MLPTRSARVALSHAVPSRVAAAALAIVAIACGNPTKPKATYVSSEAAYTLYALTGAPVNAATALHFLGGAARADASFTFDVAFDLDATGKVLVYPVRTIGGGLGGSLKSLGVLTRVGLQPVTGPFDAVTAAPATGYDTLSIQTIVPGAVLAAEVLDYATCVNSLGGQTMYSKLTVDSVDQSARRIYVRAVVDPNCGYRELVADSLPNS